ncbi:MAG: recombinase family protein [Bacilli bacterium]|nr:recombinase family protein [Bacilli bacterium]
MAQVEIIKPNLISKSVNTIKRILKRVCAYCRVSTDSEEQLNSYESQIEHYGEFIKSNPDWEFVGIYADEGISGTQVKNRCEFQRMIDDALNGKIDMIIAKSISRFARNTLDTLKYCRILREKNIDVYFEKENIHTIDLDSEMFLTFYSAFAQGESESTSQNVKMGIRAMMKRGEFVGKAESYGFKWNKELKTLEVFEEQAEVVRMIFNWYADGIGTRTIANRLNEKGYKSYTGKNFTQQGVREMISNEKYVGDLRMQKYYTVSPITHKKQRNYGEKEQYYVKDHHTPIVSREVWNKCQEILSKRSRKIIPDGKSHSSKFTNKYPFSSKIECGICGTNYSHRVSGKLKSGKQNVYWSCYHKVVNKDNCPESLTLRENVLEEIFVQIYNSVITKRHKTKDKLLMAIKDTLSEDDSKIKLDKLYKDKDTLQKRLSNLIDLKLDNIENKDAYNEKEKEINEQLKIINSKINEYEMIKDTNDKMTKQLKEIESIISESEKPLKEFDRTCFERFFDKIIVGVVDENGNINPNVIRFILKLGGDYIGKYNKETNRIDDVSFVMGNRIMPSRCRNYARTL